MTEDQAKAKWCPFVVASHTNPRQRAWVDGDVGEPTGTLHHNCLGSECMAWRWRDQIAEAVDGPEGLSLNVSVDHSSGFCGLAGAPRQ